MPLIVSPVTAVQPPEELIRNHQLLGPSFRVRSTERSLLTTADSEACGMANVVVAIWVPQLLLE